MTFTKIKYDPSTIETTLRWEEPGETGIDKHELVSNDEPHPDFVDALEALKIVVCKACNVLPTPSEIAREENQDRIIEDKDMLNNHIEMTIRGVTLKETSGPDGTVGGVTITALRKLDWCAAPLVINTPFAPIESVPHSSTERLLNDLIDEAENFLGGKRKQADLFTTEMVEAARDMSPREGSGIDSVTISVPGSGIEPAVLTKETRRKLDRKLASA